MDHVVVDVPHLVVGEVETVQGRVAEDAGVDVGHVVVVQLEGLQQIVFVEVTVGDFLDLVPERVLL